MCSKWGLTYSSLLFHPNTVIQNDKILLYCTHRPFSSQLRVSCLQGDSDIKQRMNGANPAGDLPQIILKIVALL